MSLGWDYSGRFLKDPLAGNSLDRLPALRTLNVRNTIPVDLNSILCMYHSSTFSRERTVDPVSPPDKAFEILADYFHKTGSISKATDYHKVALEIRGGIMDLFWDPKKLAFYDYNLTSNARNDFYSAATFYPFWAGIVPPEVLSDQHKAFGAFSAVNLVLNRYNGTFPATFVETTLQWDSPNAWPPHQYIALEALRNLPGNLTTDALPQPGKGQNSFHLVPSGQLGITENQLIAQPISGGGSVRGDVNKLNGTVINGGTDDRRQQVTSASLFLARCDETEGRKWRENPTSVARGRCVGGSTGICTHQNSTLFS